MVTPNAVPSGILDEGPGVMASGDGMPVAMLHSSLSSKSQWRALVQRLAPEFRAVAVDLCGYGDNAMPRDPHTFTLDDEVELVRSRLRTVCERRDPIHLVGHSYGGAVALRYALRYPGDVASLVLFEPVAFQLLAPADPLVATIRHVKEDVDRALAGNDSAEATRVFVDFWNGAGTFAALPLPAKMKMASRIAKIGLEFDAIFRDPLTIDDCRSLRAPTLLLGGIHSPEIASRIVCLLSAAIPDSCSTWVHGGHMAPIVASECVNARIHAFVGKVAAANESRI